MRFSLVAAALLGLASSRLVLAAEDAPVVASDVVDLTKDSFPKFVAEEKLALVEFFAPWCGHCKALAPEYETAATALKASKLALAKVDCTEQAELCEAEGVKGYPTLKLFRDGKPAEYKGPRKADGIVSFMKKQSMPAISILEAEQIEAFTKEDKVVVVGFFTDKESSEYVEFSKAAESARDDFLFGATFGAAAAEANKIAAPGIILFKSFDEGKNLFGATSSKFTADLILEFVKANSVPVMDEISPENYSTYVERGLHIAYLFYGSPEDKAAVGPAVEKVAKKFIGKLSFVYIDAVKFGGHGQNLNLRQEWPAFAIQEPAKNLKYPFDQTAEITEESITKFVQSLLDGELDPSLKTEEVPEKNDDPVTIVVGSTYDQIVSDPKNDVFIELYAPWCGHCKSLAPIWEELGEYLKDTPNVVIAKMDGTVNDLPVDTPFKLEGFPTLKLYKAGTNEIVNFSGQRTLDGLLSFLKEHATNPIPEKEESAEAAPEAGAEHDEL